MEDPLYSQLLRLKATGLFGQVDEETLRSITGELEECHVAGGDTVLRAGEPSDSVYVVLSGRLRAYVEREGKEHAVGEIGSGDSVGEMAVLTDEPRSATVRALRDSELVRLSRETFDQLLRRYPGAMMAVTRSIVERLKAVNLGWQPPRSVSTIALLPIGRRPAPASVFAEPFAQALDRLGSVARVSRDRARHEVGADAVEPGAEGTDQQARFVSWLAQIELDHRFTLLEAEASVTPWTERCLRQADRVLLVADVREGGEPAELPWPLRERGRPMPAADLVLVHAEDMRQPSGTSDWLRAYAPQQHFHVRDRHAGDCQRLVRLITGHAVTLVLSGGGARGYAHIGVLRALEELSVPIDAIGGTSIGSLIAAQYAAGQSPAEIIEGQRRTLVRRPPQYNFTLPIVSLVSGSRFTGLLRELFGELRIEDLCLPFFCVSSNLSRAEVMIHESGPVWSSVRASGTLPGVGPPNPYHGDLLVDGGVLNNLPIDIMRDRHSGTVLAVDVVQKVDFTSNADWVDGLSGWKVLLDRLLSLQSSTRIPDIMSILARTATLASAHNAERVCRMADLYLRPPVQRFETLGWRHLDEVAEEGYRYALPILSAWKATRELSTWRATARRL